MVRSPCLSSTRRPSPPQEHVSHIIEISNAAILALTCAVRNKMATLAILTTLLTTSALAQTGRKTFFPPGLNSTAYITVRFRHYTITPTSLQR